MKIKVPTNDTGSNQDLDRQSPRKEIQLINQDKASIKV
jgi:hypothetical protein